MVRLFLIVLSVTLFSCKTCQPTQKSRNESVKNPSVMFNELNSGNNGGFNEKTNKVITSQTELDALWEAAFVNYMLKEKAPVVDFKTQTVLLVALGEQNSGGSEIKVEQITETKEGLNVSVLNTKAGEGCVTSDVITYPYQIVQIEKAGKKISFSSTEKIIDCD
jgi:hypothetical protein